VAVPRDSAPADLDRFRDEAVPQQVTKRRAGDWQQAGTGALGIAHDVTLAQERWDLIDVDAELEELSAKSGV
jgi:hypothetical protein